LEGLFFLGGKLRWVFSGWPVGLALFKVRFEKLTIAELSSNNGKYHKRCKDLCSASKLERAIKRAAKADSSSTSHTSPVKTRRQSEAFEKEKCLFCNFPGTHMNSLSKVATKEISSRIIEFAKNLETGKFLQESRAPLI